MRLTLTPSLALLRTQTDARLVALAAGGSETAFSALVERYRRDVQRACGRILPESRAEDAAQQVFLAAWKALRRGDEVRDVRPWLLRIARNTALNALRVPGYDYDELRDSLTAGEAPQAELERRDVIRRTLAGMAALPERQREALLRSAVAGASHADIARDLGLSEGATRQLVLRARSTLRAAASAITPMPLVTAAAGGAAATGAGALVVKAGAVAVIAGGAIAAPQIVPTGDRPAAERRPAAASAATPEQDPAVAGTPASQPAVTPDARGGGDGDRRGRNRGRGRSGSGSDDDEREETEDRSGRRGGDDRDDDDSGRNRRRNRGGDGISGGDTSGSDDSGSSGSDDSGSSGSDDEPDELDPDKLDEPDEFDPDEPDEPDEPDDDD